MCASVDLCVRAAVRLRVCLCVCACPGLACMSVCVCAGLRPCFLSGGVSLCLRVHDHEITRTNEQASGNFIAGVRKFHLKIRVRFEVPLQTSMRQEIH